MGPLDPSSRAWDRMSLSTSSSREVSAGVLRCSRERMRGESGMGIERERGAASRASPPLGEEARKPYPAAVSTPAPTSACNAPVSASTSACAVAAHETDCFLPLLLLRLLFVALPCNARLVARASTARGTEDDRPFPCPYEPLPGTARCPLADPARSLPCMCLWALPLPLACCRLPHAGIRRPCSVRRPAGDRVADDVLPWLWPCALWAWYPECGLARVPEA